MLKIIRFAPSSHFSQCVRVQYARSSVNTKSTPYVIDWMSCVVGKLLCTLKLNPPIDPGLARKGQESSLMLLDSSTKANQLSLRNRNLILTESAQLHIYDAYPLDVCHFKYFVSIAWNGVSVDSFPSRSFHAKNDSKGISPRRAV